MVHITFDVSKVVSVLSLLSVHYFLENNPRSASSEDIGSIEEGSER